MACLKFVSLPAVLAALVMPGQAVLAREAPSASERFSIGTSGSVCEAQGVSMGETRASIYERKWMILCRDIARPIGTAFALRGGDPLQRAASAREEALDCNTVGSLAIEGAGNVTATNCRGHTTGLSWTIYSQTTAGTTYVVEGLAGYDSALRLTMANLVADKPVAGTVDVVSLGSSDPIAFARARAAVSDVDTLIGQGYRGNSAGAYAEAAELFAAAPALLSADASENEAKLHELKVNRALQLSNLGEFDQATRLFAEARAMPTRDPVQLRLGRNFEAINALNRGDIDAIPGILDRAMPPLAAPAADISDGSVRIDNSTAAGINAANGADLAGVLGQETRLSPTERATILDAQASQLRGTAQRLQGDTAGARISLNRAYADAMRVRNGRVVSIMRLRSQILSELALTYEAESRFGDAEATLKQAIELVEKQYPESASVNAARARLAGFLYRRDRKADAADIYRSITQNVAGNRGALVGMANMMQPYFDLLTDAASQQQSAADLFLAAQLVERPGAADTLAQLSRQLEGGDSRSSDLFRQSLSLNREAERNRMRITQAEATGDAAALADAQDRQKRLLDAQLQIMNSLAEFPQYRAVANRYVTLDELRGTLQPGEAYLKLVQLGGAAYAVYVSPSTAKGWRVEKSAQELADMVAGLRDSISVTVNSVRSTYPFDVDAALALNEALLGPVAAELPSVRHLVFEPDGALLQLPINLLTDDREGVTAYHHRVDAGGDEFDFTHIAWLGRDRAISTALSAASFRDARQVPASKATLSYLGLGQNAPLGPVTALPVRSVAGSSRAEAGCDWPIAAWNSPISANELQAASGIFGRSSSDLMTGPAFTDTAIMARPDLSAFRIVHFATHGLVTAPRDGCPARPALLTSYGDRQSDGLLTFGEIFNLTLDADLVILSACDTAGQASLEATLEAGVTTGGGQALDGLVRAFIAAGGRQVIASHWPAPDDYNATQRLFSGFFADSGGSVGDALLQAQRGLMDDPATSHPFYWAGFAIIGDGARPLPGH